MLWSTTGRLDFDALQAGTAAPGRGAQELARTEPSHLILFDVLRIQDHDLTGSPMGQRCAQLEHLLTSAGPAVLVAGMQTNEIEVARTGFDQLAAAGMEGIVAHRGRTDFGRDHTRRQRNPGRI